MENGKLEIYSRSSLTASQIPECVLKLKKDDDWKKVKDVMRSSIQDNPKDPAEVNIREGTQGAIAVCNMKDPDHAREAYCKE